MKKLKIATVVGTRPELIRLSRLIPLLDERCEHVFIHTGQNNSPHLKDVFFSELGLRSPDYFLDCNTTTFATVMADTMVKCHEVFVRARPDAVLVLGDTNSSVAAIVAERLQIPVYHMEAGNRSFDANVPEELNRRMVDHVATFNLPYNSISERNLLNEGLNSRFIMKTGSPMRQVLSFYGENIEASQALQRHGLEPKGYLLASLHRQENVDLKSRLTKLIAGLSELSRHFNKPVLISTHPRTLAKLRKYGIEGDSNLNFVEPLGFFDYCKLQKESLLVISDSGTISEESALLGFAAITPRDSMERPEALETAGIVLTGIEPDSIVRGAEQALLSLGLSRPLPEGYEVEDFSERVFNFVVSTAVLAGAWRGVRPLEQ